MIYPEKTKKIRRNLNTAMVIGASLLSTLALPEKSSAKEYNGPAVINVGKAIHKESPKYKENAKPPTEVIKKCVNELGSIRVGDKFRVLEGKTSNLIFKKGATIYKAKGNQVKRSELTEDTEVIHAKYDENDGWHLASFRGDSETICLPFTGHNKRYISEIYVDSEGKPHTKSFQSSDITSRQIHVNYVKYGNPFTNTFSTQDHLSHLISTEINGTPLVPVAIGYTSTDPSKN